MTFDEFVRWETDDGVVRLGELADDFILVKARGERSAPVATREQYETFTCSYAHAFADEDAVKRFGIQIARLKDLRPFREIPSLPKTEGKTHDRLRIDPSARPIRG